MQVKVVVLPFFRPWLEDVRAQLTHGSGVPFVYQSHTGSTPIWLYIGNTSFPERMNVQKVVRQVPKIDRANTMFPNWDWTMLAVSASFHSVAIFSTVFRLWYRCYTAHLWWDDAWVMVALSADIACLVMTLLERPIPDDGHPRYFFTGLWVVSIAYPTLMWTTRMSILASLMRITHPEGMPRRTIFGIGVFFGFMGIGMMAQRLQLCIGNLCLMRMEVLISQTTTDCIADVLLTGLPIWAFRDVNLRRKHKTLVISTFSASMVINIVTITQAVAFFRSLSSGSIIYEHVKLACSLIVCNLLVIVTFIYRILHKDEVNMQNVVPEESQYEFTPVELSLAGVSQEGKSAFAPSGRTKSSTWSFRGGSRSNASVSVTAGTSLIGSLNRE